MNEDGLYYQQQRCSPMTLDSDNIRFIRIFAGIPWKVASYNSRVIENVFFGRSDATYSAPQEMRPTLLYSIIYSLVAFPLTPKYMTLNDSEWVEWPFYAISSLLRTAAD